MNFENIGIEKPAINDNGWLNMVLINDYMYIYRFV